MKPSEQDVRRPAGGSSQPASEGRRGASRSPQSHSSAISAADTERLYRMRRLSFTYGEGFHLTIEDLEIRRGEKLAIVGHNGSGKTTLLRILARLTAPASAAVFESPADLRPGFLRQQPYLFHDSVAGNLAYPLKLRRRPRPEIASRVRAMLERLDLQALADRPAGELSGGERKRLALGRVLIGEPEALLLDEPDAHLDGHSSNLIVRTLAALSQTLVLTTHDLLFAHRVAGRIVHLRDGRMIPGLPVNVMAGALAGELFRTRGGLAIHCGDRETSTVDTSITRISVDPRSIVLSHEILDSSMRNQFPGRITAARDQDGTVWLDVAVSGESLTVMISRESYERLACNVNRDVVVSFKAHAVEVW